MSLKFDINSVLKIEDFNETLLSIDDVVICGGVSSQLPLIYSKLYNNKKISLEEYQLIKRLWNNVQNSVKVCCKNKRYIPYKFQKTSVSCALQSFFKVKTISKSHRNSFNNTLRKLENYGLIQVIPTERGSLKIELSSVIFSKILRYLERYYTNVSLYSVLYLKNPDDEFCRNYRKLCKILGVNNIMSEEDCEEIIRVPIKGFRQPIIGIREPILGLRTPIFLTDKFSPKKKKTINFNAKKYEGLTDSEKKQLERMAVFGQAHVDRQLRQIRKKSFSECTQQEIDCIDNFVPYYENLICKITGRIEYNLLDHPSNKKLSKRWVSVFKCYKFCLDNGYDWKIYLDAQFDSFKNWEKIGNIPYPMPNMLYSERAVKAYENYLYHNETAYQNEGWETSLSAKETGNFREETQKTLGTDLETIQNYIKYSLKKSFNKTFKSVDKTRSDLENLYYSKAVQMQWESLSAECWVVVPQMKEFLQKMYGNYASIDAKIDLYNEILDNSKKVEVIQTIWSELGVPDLIGVFDIDKRING